MKGRLHDQWNQIDFLKYLYFKSLMKHRFNLQNAFS